MDLFRFNKEILHKKIIFCAMTDAELIAKLRTILCNLRNIFFAQYLVFRHYLTFIHLFFWRNSFQPGSIKAMKIFS